MCRLFAALSTEPLNAAFFMTEAPQSLLMQSQADARRKQGDGWGLGWFDNGRPQIFKSPKAMYRDLSSVERAAKDAKGNVLVGHVRWASNPLKLSKKELIGLDHTQPFSHGEWLFAHNGTLLIPNEVYAALGRWQRYVKGKNDSEVLFYWLMKTFIPKAGKNPAAAMRASFRGLEKIWDTCRKSYPLYKYPLHGGNVILTNGETLYALSFATPKGFDKGKGLCRKDQPYYQLQLLQSDRGITISSEPLDPAVPSVPVEHGTLITARLLKASVAVEKTKVFA